jgi:hypothetical protein
LEYILIFFLFPENVLIIGFLLKSFKELEEPQDFKEGK